MGDIYSRDAQCSDGALGDENEQPASAALAVLEAARTAPEGFLRDDALLIVVAITDEDEQPVPRMNTTLMGSPL